MEDFLLFEVVPGRPIIINLIVAYGVPLVLFLVCAVLIAINNVVAKVIGYLGGAAIAFWCMGIGAYILTEVGLIVTGLAGFALGIMFIVLLFQMATGGSETDAERKKPDQAGDPAVADGRNVLYLAGLQHARAGQYEEAKKCLKMAAKQGNRPAMSELAKIYLSRQEYDEAGQWWRPLAEAGDAAAQYRLAELLYTLGANDEADYWLARSAAQKYHRAVELEKLNYMRVEEPDDDPGKSLQS
jgi:hypothetical protein